ncbi:hypothetical protein CBS470a_013175 [Colletotrichum nupharicola]|nr:hypothetical protein CBS470a_013175 [Colletotrichum nupharicola]
MAPNQLPRVRSAEASIEKGRSAYADQRFRVALEHFTLAAALARRERGAVYAEATKECKCGAEKTWGKCHREGHVQALDYRAACFEKMGNLEKARKDAEWLLEIAPRRLEGYMRLGKIYRLEKKPELAWAIWTAGVDAGQREGLVRTTKYQVCLPTFSRFSGVCKRWETFLDTHPYIWRELHFRVTNTQKPPRVSFMKTLRKRTAGRARSLIIPNAHTFQLNQSKWISLIQTTNPQTTSRLELGGIRRNMDGDWGYKLPPKPPFFEGLSHLKFNFHHTHSEYTGRGGPQDFVRQFVERAKDNLQSLTLISIYLNDLNWPEMPRLKILQLTGPLNNTLSNLTTERRINPFALARATPNLQQLYLDNCGVFTDLDSLSPPEDCWSLWRHLQVIRLGTTRSGLSMGNKRHFPPLHPSSFRVFEARATHQGNHGDWLPQQLPLDYSGYAEASASPTAQDDKLDLVTYPNLERFWMPKLPLSVDLATILLEPAIRSGRLREVGLCWRQDPGQYFPAALDFLRGAASVRTLGFFDFDFESHEALTRDAAHRGANPNDLLFGFLESFPNLEVLELHSSLCEPARIGAVIERVVKLGRQLRRVYQRALTGVLMDQLRAFCEAHGVELVYGSWEAAFPVPLEDAEPVEAAVY